MCFFVDNLSGEEEEEGEEKKNLYNGAQNVNLALAVVEI